MAMSDYSWTARRTTPHSRSCRTSLHVNTCLTTGLDRSIAADLTSPFRTRSNRFKRRRHQSVCGGIALTWGGDGMRRRRALAALAVGIMLGSVAACGSDDATGGKTTIRFDWWGNPDRATVTEKAIDL